MGSGIFQEKINPALLAFSTTYNADAFNTQPSGNAGDNAVEPLSGDAGFRQYLRILSHPSTMAVNAPPEKEDSLAFVRTDRLLADLGLRVPRIHAVDFSHGFLLLEDFGDSLLSQNVTGGHADENYALAMDQLIRLQRCRIRPTWLPAYDEKLLGEELELFRHWFLSKLLSIDLSDQVSRSLSELFEMLIQEASSQPKTIVHRDFHARNLMCLSDGGIGVIDFQDAVWGPITYDAVSLAKDCYLRWSESRLTQFMADYSDRLIEENLLAESDREKFPRWFDLMGLQRHIKVLGIFARLYLRDSKSGYLKDLPLVLRYTLEVLSKYDQCADISAWMQAEVIPACEAKPWYHDWRTAGIDVQVP